MSLLETDEILFRGCPHSFRRIKHLWGSEFSEKYFSDGIIKKHLGCSRILGYQQNLWGIHSEISEGHQIYLRISWTISENIRIYRWSSERLKDIMRSLSEYHFRDMHQVILSTEKEANTTSQTARAVCMQNNGMLCVCFSFENQICQGSSFWQSLDISGDWISNTFDDYHHALVYFKINIALMVRD